jgi:DNA (cytosine-5)-methyltransferase 1
LTAYYNENNAYCAAWLRNLIDIGEIAPGDVDDRDIRQVQPDDLKGYDQCHFFAGIGVWSYAARIARWPDDRPFWSASCPCPPFSSASPQFRCPQCDTPSPVPDALRTGEFNCIRCEHRWAADERHLWPEFFRLRRHYPDVPVVGEQVASPDGLVWLDLVRASLEMVGNAVAHEVSCAAGVGAPHNRARLYFAALVDGERAGLERHGGDVGRGGQSGRVGEDAAGSVAAAGGLDELANSDKQRDSGRGPEGRDGSGPDGSLDPRIWPGPVNGFWRDADWLRCTDEKWRPVGSGTFPLVDGVAFKLGSGGPYEGKSRQEMLRAYGNAIVAPQAAAFIRYVMEELL